MTEINHQDITELLEEYPNGLKAIEIASKLNVTRRLINQLLYRYKDRLFRQDAFYCWHVIRNADQEANKQEQVAEYIKQGKDPLMELFNPDHFGTVDFGFEEYHVGIDGKNYIAFDEDSLWDVKSAIATTYLDDYITLEDFEDIVVSYQVPVRYYDELAEYVADSNREVYQNNLINDYILSNTAKEKEKAQKSACDKKTSDVSNNKKQPVQDEEDESILLDTFDELSYFHKKNMKNGEIRPDSTVFILQIGEIQQTKINLKENTNLETKLCQGDSIETNLDRVAVLTYRLTIKGMKKGLSILECFTQSSSIQLAIIVL